MADSQQATEETAGEVQVENDTLPAEDKTQEVGPIEVEIHKIEQNGPKQAESDSPKSDNGEAKLKSKNGPQASPKLKRGSTGSPLGNKLDKDRISSNLTIDQRKQNAEELRKKKLGDLRKKEDDKRKAVLERKKKIEEEERKKADALLKKLQVTSPNSQSKRPSSAPARRSQSTSNLFHLKKMQSVSRDVDISGNKKRESFSSDGASSTASVKFDKKKRPSSAMERRRTGSFSDATASSMNKTMVSGGPISPDSSKTNKTAVRQRTEPRVRQSLGSMPQRPVSSLGVRMRPESQRKSIGPIKATTPIQPQTTKPSKPLSATRPKEMQKSKSASSVLTQKDTKPRPPHKETRPKQSISPSEVKTKSPTEVKTKPPIASVTKAKTTTDAKSKVPSEAKPKTTTKPPSPTRPKKSSAQKKSGGSSLPPPLNEEEAKKLLAERRRQVKEEAEKQAVVDKAQQEEEQRKQEEEAKRLEEEFLLEQQKQNEMIEQLRKDEEQRQIIAQEEKERKEMVEIQKIEVEKKQREEELNRKKEEELDRRAKEREKTRQGEEAERNERKKRIEAIMSKVQRPVTPTFQDDSSERILTTVNGDDNSGQVSPPGSDNGESAKEKADRIIQKMKANGNRSPSEPIIFEDRKRTEPVKDFEGNVTENRVINVSDEIEIIRPTVSDEVANKSITITTNDNENCEDIEFDSQLAAADQQALLQLEKEQQEQFIDGDNEDQMTITTTVVHSDNTITNGNLSNNNQVGKRMVGEENVDKEAEQQNLWSAAEQAMKESNDSVLNSLEKKGLVPSDEHEANKESQLWQVAEGRLELEECF